MTPHHKSLSLSICHSFRRWLRYHPLLTCRPLLHPPPLDHLRRCHHLLTYRRPPPPRPPLRHPLRHHHRAQPRIKRCLTSGSCSVCSGFRRHVVHPCHQRREAVFPAPSHPAVTQEESTQICNRTNSSSKYLLLNESMTRTLSDNQTLAKNRNCLRSQAQASESTRIVLIGTESETSNQRSPNCTIVHMYTQVEPREPTAELPTRKQKTYPGEI
jgi:hypothetical protein